MNEAKKTPLLLLLASFIIVLWGVAAAKDFFVPLCLAALLAFAMAPAVRFLRRYNLPEWLSVLIAALLVLVPLGSVLYFAVVEIQLVVADWPRILASIKTTAGNLQNSHWAHTLNLQHYLEPQAFSQKIGEMAGSGAMLMLGGMLTVLSAGTTFVLIIFFALMMLLSRRHLRRAADYAFVTWEATKSSALLDDITSLIEAFLLARFGITFVSAVASGLILAFFGIPYAFLIALFYGLMTWVPVVGIALALVPVIAVAVAAGDTGFSLLLALILLTVVWIIQDHVLQPKWLGGRLKLNFFATYLALFIGEHLWGAWGMFLSVPLLGVARIILSANRDLKPIAFAMSEEEDPKLF